MDPLTTPLPARAPVGFSTSLAAQLRLLAWSRRGLTLAGALLTLPVLLTLFGMGGELLLGTAGVFAVAAGALWAMPVWAGEPPGRRVYHDTLPVSRGAHDLARVVAGGAVLVAACAVMVAGCSALVIARGAGGTLRTLPPVAWPALLAAPLVAYLVASPLALWSRSRVLRWLLGGWVAFAWVAILSRNDLAMRVVMIVMAPAFEHDRLGLAHVLMDGSVAALGAAGEGSLAATPGAWALATLLWLGVGLALSAAAARWRQDDVARALRR
jgi:hypothetical protein